MPRPVDHCVPLASWATEIFHGVQVGMPSLWEMYLGSLGEKEGEGLFHHDAPSPNVVLSLGTSDKLLLLGKV